MKPIRLLENDLMKDFNQFKVRQLSPEYMNKYTAFLLLNGEMLTRGYGKIIHDQDNINLCN